MKKKDRRNLTKPGLQLLASFAALATTACYEFSPDHQDDGVWRLNRVTGEVCHFFLAAGSGVELFGCAKEAE